MKNSTNKSTLLAIACFVALGFFATLTAHSQEDNPLISSPLITTTGAAFYQLNYDIYLSHI